VYGGLKPARAMFRRRTLRSSGRVVQITSAPLMKADEGTVTQGTLNGWSWILVITEGKFR
jgi:hypothetical protein